jgi:gas vesicle structural protein
MAVRRTMSSAEILDRVLDKGIVIDGWLNVSVVGLDLIGLQGRVVVASLTTYAKHSKTVDRVLGRGRRAANAAAPLPAIPGRQNALATPDVAPAQRRWCPRCGKRDRRQDVVLVTVQTNTETRVTARCSVCSWQNTEAL